VDTKKESEAPLSFWGTAQQEIIHILSQAVPLAKGALIVISSFWGAYYHGDSPGPQSSSCRYVLCRIPKKFGQFGFPSWNLVPWREDENAGGGNMPGLQTAGKIWGCPTKISKPAPEGMGYEQSTADRRLL
jgi:hypothetical protein